MDTHVPFISNTPDDKHCLQAAYAMVRQFFEPELELDWDDWSEITGYLPGKGTWSMAGLMWFKDHGYDVVHIGTFDYEAFAERGDQYLLEALGEEVGKWKLQYMDLKLEQARAVRFLQSKIWINREATIDDIKNYLQEGYLVKCLVNLNALNNKPGYLGHAVIVKGYTDTDIILHDPGLPAFPDRHVDMEHFVRAWIDPEAKSEKMDAIRKLPTTQELDEGILVPLAETIADEPLIAA
ncbi:MAG TPA: C39 family peptidase [Candidatus Limnocylindrales bacterium]|nr:C39 family peptidase [Candidatus Limnocylindrales bacterium]